MKRTVKAGRVIITRPFEGLSINTETQVLKMRNRILSFKDKAKATRFCTTHGINIETVDFVLLKEDIEYEVKNGKNQDEHQADN